MVFIDRMSGKFKTKMKKIWQFFVFFAVAFVTSSVFSAEISVQVSDTIAGYSTSMRSFSGSPGQKVTFRVEKSDGAIIEISENANQSGIAEVDFSGFHTKKTGTYKVCAYFFGENLKNCQQKNFEVFPDSVSPIYSRIEMIRETVPADQKTAGEIKILILDRYSNPIPNHKIVLISSRNDDIIKYSSSEVTNKFGEIFFDIFSDQEGISYFSAIDRQTGITLEDRGKIIFFENSKSNEQIGGNYFSANIFGSDLDDDENFGPIDYFDIEFPEQVEVNSDTNFLKIIARDENGNISKNYTGRILISVPNDENAILPGNGEYQFSEKDQGVAKFDLALIFSKIGNQKILVNDFEDGKISQFIKGEKTIEVIEKCSGQNCDPFSSGNGEDFENVSISSPAKDSKFANSQISLSGKARPNSNLKVFLNDREIKEIETDSDGVFLSEINSLEDGDHEIFVQEIGGFAEKSAVINFSIDKTPPKLDEFSVYPTGNIFCGEGFSVIFFSEPNLSSTNVRFAGITGIAEEDISVPGKYLATFQAPQNPGEFGISLELSDQMQNTSNFVNQAQIHVIEKIEILSAVSNLKIEPLNSSAKITFEPISENEKVKKYQILVGKNKFFLEPKKEILSTENEVEIFNLENNKEYFFAVVAIDQNGNSGEKSEIISATPISKTIENTNKKPLENLKPSPPVDPNLIIKPNPTPKNFTGVFGDGIIKLSWDKSETNPTFFDIRFGFSEQNLTERISVPGNQTSTIIRDLINNHDYYFSIIPMDRNGIPIENETYSTLKISPQFSGLHQAAKSEKINIFQKFNKSSASGPESIFVFIIALFFAFGFSILRMNNAVKKN